MEMNTVDFIMAEFAVNTHAEDSYTYRPPDGLDIAYYILDMQKLFSESSLKPTYCSKASIESLGLKEPELFEKVLHNTLTMLPRTILSLSQFLENVQKLTSDPKVCLLLTAVINKFKSHDADTNVWCITNSLYYGAAIGMYDFRLLNEFCHENGFTRILLGIGNKDYAYLMRDSEKNLKNMEMLLRNSADFFEDGIPLPEKAVFVYDSLTSKLKRI